MAETDLTVVVQRLGLSPAGRPQGKITVGKQRHGSYIIFQFGMGKGGSGRDVRL